MRNTFSTQNLSANYEENVKAATTGETKIHCKIYVLDFYYSLILLHTCNKIDSNEPTIFLGLERRTTEWPGMISAEKTFFSETL